MDYARGRGFCVRYVLFAHRVSGLSWVTRITLSAQWLDRAQHDPHGARPGALRCCAPRHSEQMRTQLRHLCNHKGISDGAPGSVSVVQRLQDALRSCPEIRSSSVGARGAEPQISKTDPIAVTLSPWIDPLDDSLAWSCPRASRSGAAPWAPRARRATFATASAAPATP
jgi:hypothetical protein